MSLCIMNDNYIRTFGATDIGATDICALFFWQCVGKQS